MFRARYHGAHGGEAKCLLNSCALAGENVPDLAGFAVANDLVGKPDSEVREAIGDKFPEHIYHSIVCIGALIAHRELIAGRGPGKSVATGGNAVVEREQVMVGMGERTEPAWFAG